MLEFGLFYCPLWIRRVLVRAQEGQWPAHQRRPLAWLGLVAQAREAESAARAPGRAQAIEKHQSECQPRQVAVSTSFVSLLKEPFAAWTKWKVVSSVKDSPRVALLMWTASRVLKVKLTASGVGELNSS